jgi:hypothetical protein
MRTLILKHGLLLFSACFLLAACGGKATKASKLNRKLKGNTFEGNSKDLAAKVVSKKCLDLAALKKFMNESGADGNVAYVMYVRDIVIGEVDQAQTLRNKQLSLKPNPADPVNTQPLKAVYYPDALGQPLLAVVAQTECRSVKLAANDVEFGIESSTPVQLVLKELLSTNQRSYTLRLAEDELVISDFEPQVGNKNVFRKTTYVVTWGNKGLANAVLTEAYARRLGITAKGKNGMVEVRYPVLQRKM